MINGYTESEICALYRQAKNKKLQIEILTQLTGLMDFQIIGILEKGGYLVAKKNLVLREKIKELHAQNLTTAEIAKQVNTAYSNAFRYLKELGLEPNIKEEKQVEKESSYDVVEKLKEETKKNVEELKQILPKGIDKVDPDDLPIAYDIVEEISPQQYYELAKLTLDLLKTIWG